MALEFLGDAFKDDLEIVGPAVLKDPRCLFRASNAIRSNVDLVKKAIDIDVWTFICMSDTLMNDISIMK